MSKATEVEVIEGLELDGLNKDDAFDIMMGDFNMKLSTANKYWAAHGSKNKGGIFQTTLDWLAEEPRTESAFADFVIEHGTKNEARWFGSRNAIRIVTVKIFDDAEFVEVAITETQKKVLKSIVG